MTGNEQPLVSVIINCYNGEKFVREAIDSVLAQTYRHWELIFWDNCSEDATPTIAQSYQDARIRYFRAEKNTTLGVARNLAMAKAMGEFVTFLDSDDYWSAEFLEKAVQPLVGNPELGLCYTRLYIFSKKVASDSHKPLAPRIVSLKELASHYNIPMSACICRTRVIREHQVEFNTCFSLIEDYDFFIKIASYSQAYYLPEPLSYYRYHTGNLSHSDRWVSEFRLMMENIESKKTGYVQLADIKEGILNTSRKYEASEYIRNNDRIGGIKYILTHSSSCPYLWHYLPGILLGEKLFNFVKFKIVHRIA